MKDIFAVTAIVVGLFTCVILSCLLISSGAGDHPQSYRVWIIAGAVILGSGIIASAIRQNK